MTDERQQDGELNRFWNALVQCTGEPAPETLDPDQAETVRQLHAMTRTPPPASARARTDHATKTLSAVPHTDRRSNGHAVSDLRRTDTLPVGAAAKNRDQATPAHWAARSAQHRATGRLRVASVSFATALLLLLTLGLAYVTLGPGNPGVRRAVLPALSGEPPRETVLEIALPADALPHGSNISASLTHFSLDPGAESSWTPAPGACCPGLRLNYVIDGSLIVRPTTAARVLRAGASLSPDVIAAGTQIVLGPGDVLMTRYADAFSSANGGTTPVQLLDIAFIEGFFPLTTEPSAWEIHHDADVAYGLSVPDAPATVRLHQVALAPGAVLAPPPEAITQLGITLAEAMPLRIQHTDTIENINQELVTVHVVTLTAEIAGDAET